MIAYTVGCTFTDPAVAEAWLAWLRDGHLADVRLVESVNLRIEEASLTGESVAVGKDARDVLAAKTGLGDQHNMAFMSTVITYGRGQGLVASTGMDTEIGKIAEMIQSYEEEATPLQNRLDQLGKWLGWGALAWHARRLPM